MDPLDRRTVLLGLIGAAGLATSGCTGSEPGAAATSNPPAPTSPPTTSTPTPTPSVDTRPRWPLRGTLLKDPDAALHPAVAVKVPDNKYEHPHVGLDHADIVFVELDGYRDGNGNSGTRLVPVFHSDLPTDVGPVRSIRPVDVPLLAPMHAMIGSTGATAWVTAYAAEFEDVLDSRHTYVATRGTGAYSINPDRVRTYQGNTYYDQAVVCHPTVLAKQKTNVSKGPAKPYFPWATGDEDPSTATGKGADTLSVPWHRAGAFSMTYTWREKSGDYARSMPWGPHVLANGKRVTTENVLILQTDVVYGRITAQGEIYQGAHAEPIYQIIEAKGTFTYAQGGRVVKGTWRKGAVHERFAFTLADGAALRMAPGRTYVELPPAGSTVRLG
jgi:hypothetical protein